MQETACYDPMWCFKDGELVPTCDGWKEVCSIVRKTRKQVVGRDSENKLYYANLSDQSDTEEEDEEYGNIPVDLGKVPCHRKPRSKSVVSQDKEEDMPT